MTEDLIAEKAAEFEFTNGTYAFKEAVKWTLKQINTKDNDDVSIDFHSYTVSYKGKLVKLPKTAFKLLDYFLKNKNKLLTKHDILSSVWEQTEFIDERTIDVHIFKLRSEFGSDCIQSIKRVGYKWVK